MILTTTLSHIASIPELSRQGRRAVALQVGRCENIDVPLRLSNPRIKAFNLTNMDKMWLVLHTQTQTPEYEANVRQLRAWIADTAMRSAIEIGYLGDALRHDVNTAEHRLAVVDAMMQLKDGTVERSLAEAYYWATLPVHLKNSAAGETWNAVVHLVDAACASSPCKWAIATSYGMVYKLTELFDTEDV